MSLGLDVAFGRDTIRAIPEWTAQWMDIFIKCVYSKVAQYMNKKKGIICLLQALS